MIGHEHVIGGALGLLGSLRASGECGTASTDEASRLGRVALDLLVAERDAAEEALQVLGADHYFARAEIAEARLEALSKQVLRACQFLPMTVSTATEKDYEDDHPSRAGVILRTALHEMRKDGQAA